MKNLTINETPVRTSNNFKINNITLEDLEIPTNVENFENAEIICKNRIHRYYICRKRAKPWYRI